MSNFAFSRRFGYVGRSDGLEKFQPRAFSFPIFIARHELENLDRQMHASRLFLFPPFSLFIVFHFLFLFLLPPLLFLLLFLLLLLLLVSS